MTVCPDREARKQGGSANNKETLKIGEIIFPKNWKELSARDQKEWITSYYMPKTRRPEPILTRHEKIKKGIIKLESGAKLEFPRKLITTSKRNPNLVREFEGWAGKWLVTVFRDNSFPYIKYFGISNPSRDKWIAQELSSEICNEFYAILLGIRWKYGFFRGKRRKKRRKNSVFTLSLKDSNTRGSFQ